MTFYFLQAGTTLDMTVFLHAKLSMVKELLLCFLHLLPHKKDYTFIYSHFMRMVSDIVLEKINYGVEVMEDAVAKVKRMLKEIEDYYEDMLKEAGELIEEGKRICEIENTRKIQNEEKTYGKD